MDRMTAAERIKINRWLLVLLTVGAATLGLAPLALFLGRPRLLWYALGGCALLAFATVFRTRSGKGKTHAANSPGFLEFLIGGLAMIYVPAFGGILSLILYCAVYGVAWLLGALFSWLGLGIQVSPGLVATYPSAVLAAGVALISGVRTDELRDKLYKEVAGTKSDFYDLIARQRRWLIGCGTVAVIVLGIVGTTGILRQVVDTWIYVLLQLFLTVVSAPLWIAGELTSTSPRAVRAVAKLLKGMDYQITESPRTGDEAFDPLLINVDLLAYDGEHAFAVQVRTEGGSSAPPDWTAASALQNAAWALDDVGPDFGLTSQEVEPCMVLVGIEPDKRLREFSAEGGFWLVEVPDKGVIDQVILTEDEGDLRELARQYLGALAAGEHAQSPDDGPDGPGGQR
ncbi:MAG: hypothetical protein ISS56_12335 [Anaerolineae bacterium]|nr:hypothetical protein [Anaerolineae bacterium]